MNQLASTTSDQRRWPNPRLGRISAAIAIALALAHVPVHAETSAVAGQDSTQQQTADASPQSSPNTKKINTPSSEKQPANLSAVTVTGVRASLESAIAIKRDSDQIVDSIVAEDIGKLPDSNVAEALQRISGIQIARNFGEGSSIAIRGLTQVRTEINGRDAFTANGGRALSFEDVPSELLAGVDVYKDPSAEIIEGGVGGTVNLRTHKPFDFAGQKISGSVEYNYFDLASKGKPSASFLYSNRWNTDVGEFGVLVDVAYQKHAYRRDEISTEPFYEIQASPDSAQTNYPGYDGKTLYVPHGGDIGQAGGDRRRLGTVVALQWRPNDDVELYAQGFRSAYKFLTHATSYAVYTGDSPIIPDASQPFSFDPNGNFLSGTFNGTGDGNGGVTDGVGVDSNASLTQRYSVTTDLSLGGSWNVTNNLTLTTDLQYTKATTKETNVILDMGTRTPYLFQDISGRTPTLQVPAGYTTNPANNTYSWLLDNKDRSTGNEFAWRADAEYTLGGDFFRSIKAGVRTTNRRAVTDSTNYSHFVTLGQPLSDYPDSTWVTTSYGNFFRGESNTFGSILSPNPAELADYPDSLPTYGINSLLQYTPSGRNNQGEKTYAAYGVLRFGWDMGNIPVDGNVGMRAVQTKVDSSGFRNEPGNSGRLLPLDVSQSYNSYLPSLNLSVHLTPDLQWRLAASKAISRPNFSDMNPNLSLNVADANSATPSYTGAAGNPNLKPMTAKQYDTSLEWYYGRGSLLYGDLFYKNVSGFIANTVFNESYDGHAYQVSRPVNGGDGIIKGAEIGWQTFFDFLPAPFDGLGLQTNYTYVYSAAPSPGATDTSGNTLTVPLEGLSKNSYNVIAMYEKGPFQARIAYNWRSLWVITTQGVGSGNLPEYNKAYGQVDVSATYEINDHFQLTASAVNLANAHTDIQSGLHGRPRHLQIDDRQFTLKAQLSF